MDRCEKAPADAVRLPDEYFSESELYPEAFSMARRTRSPAYDMFFVVLARRTNGYLLTLDQTLKNLAAKNAVRVL